MKKLNPFLSALLFSFILISCQKDAGTPADLDPNDPANPVVSSDDPVGLSGAIRVWHGTRTPGNLPQSNSTLPTLDPAANPSVEAIAGRYAIIKPEILDGDVEGYYVGIAGSGQYFKVDYTTPRDIAGRTQKKNPFSGRLFNPQDGVADSSIVIVLPSNIQVPDTFCVTYSAYDALGNVGAPVTTCIYVHELGGEAESAWLQNDWKITALWDLDANGERNWEDTIIYNKWYSTESCLDYICITDPQTGSSMITVQDMLSSQPVITSDSLFTRKYNIRFASNGAFEAIMDEDYSALTHASTCTQFVYDISTYDEFTIGGWSYDEGSGTLKLIYETDPNGDTQYMFEVYEVIKIDNTHMVLKLKNESDYFRLVR